MTTTIRWTTRGGDCRRMGGDDAASDARAFLDTCWRPQTWSASAVLDRVTTK